MTACTRRGCDRPATHAISGEYDTQPWHGCTEHQAAMAKAMGLGQRVDYMVTVTPLDKPVPR